MKKLYIYLKSGITLTVSNDEIDHISGVVDYERADYELTVYGLTDYIADCKAWNKMIEFVAEIPQGDKHLIQEYFIPSELVSWYMVVTE